MKKAKIKNAIMGSIYASGIILTICVIFTLIVTFVDWDWLFFIDVLPKILRISLLFAIFGFIGGLFYE